MTPLYDTQDFYKKMLELQERLRKSEEERIKLEERFNLLSQESRNRREACMNNLRMRYIDFLEEQRIRDERNHQILGALNKIDGSLSRMTARTDRLGILRKQYEAYLLRIYANRSSGGGTGDSGVGSHNENRSPKNNISQSEKISSMPQRSVTRNAGDPAFLIPQTNYPQSYIGISNISHAQGQDNAPRYIPGQETSQLHVMQAHGQGDSSKIVHPQHISQEFCGTQNLNTPNISVLKTQPMANIPQDFVPQNRNYQQHFGAETFSRSNNQLASNYTQVQHQFHDIPNNYTEIPGSPYAGDPSIMGLRNFTDPQGIISSNLRPLHGLQSARINARAMPNISDLTDESFGPYRHSTPLPGYLDYSTRYSRDPSMHEPDVALRYGFTRSDLEKVIDRNERILPKDYLHNPETVKPTTHTSPFVSLLETKEKNADIGASKGMNDDELDQYINRIRSRHRDNDQSLEALDVEQNTSGDLLNATLSDDEPEQLTLHSDSRNKPDETRILSDSLKSVFALADDFVTETGKLDDGFRSNNDPLNECEILPKSIHSPQICNDKVVVKPTPVESSDASPAMLRADMTSDNLSISITRDDILSETASLGINQIQDTSATANVRCGSKITPPIADIETSRLNVTNIATLSQNNLVDPNKLLPNERGSNQVLSTSSQEHLKILEKEHDSDKEVINEQRTSIEVPNESVEEDHGLFPRETEIHEDIDGDEVSLIAREQMPEQLSNVIEELQPPSLQHHEKNFVEVLEDNENNEDARTGNKLPNDVVGPRTQKIEDSFLSKDLVTLKITENSPQDFIAPKNYVECDVTDLKIPGTGEVKEPTLNDPKKEIIEVEQCQDDVDQKLDLDPGRERPANEHQPGQKFAQKDDAHCDVSQRFEQNSQQVRGPGISEHFKYDTPRTNDESVRLHNEPYDTSQVYDVDQQYGTDPSQQYAQETHSQFGYDQSQHFTDNLNKQYADDPNEHYAADPNEQYTSDVNDKYANEQHITDPNKQYEADPNEQYPPGSNEDYAANPDEQYGYYENQQYQNDPNATYGNVENEQYDYVTDQGYHHDPNQQYQQDPSQQYEQDPNQQYTQDSNQQYGQQPTQQYDQDLDQQYDHNPNQQYDQDPNQQYVQDPNQQYEHHPNQQYERGQYAPDSNQQYEPDPNQQYEQDPNQQYEQYLNQQYQHDPNQEYDHETNQYKEHEYGENQHAEVAQVYEEPNYGGDQQFEDDLQQNDASRDIELHSSNQEFSSAAVEEQNEIQAATGDSYSQELLNADETRGKEYSDDQRKQSKDVIKALLESDTESTIERNPSNNTESDFDFN